MKRIAELKASDLERVPVWRYQGENDDVAVVLATELREISEAAPAAFIARTQFVLASGAQHVGFCSPCDDPGIDYLQPVIVTPDGPVYFWFDEPPTREFLARQAAMLGAKPSEVFPVKFRCTVPFGGRFITGVITSDDLTGAA